LAGPERAISSRRCSGTTPATWRTAGRRAGGRGTGGGGAWERAIVTECNCGFNVQVGRRKSVTGHDEDFSVM